jgi:hypothetical protein
MTDTISIVLGKLAVRGMEAAVRRFYDQLKADAEQELAESLRNANVSLEEAIEQNETIAMLHRWDRAWREGASRSKLRLLSRLLASEIGRGPEGADEFQQFAEIVLSLSRDELVFLAVLYEKETQAALKEPNTEKAFKIATRAFHEELVGPGKLLAHQDDFEAMGVALGRTGLVIPVRHVGGGNYFAMTMRLERLVALAGIEEWAAQKLQN